MSTVRVARIQVPLLQTTVPLDTVDLSDHAHRFPKWLAIRTHPVC